MTGAVVTAGQAYRGSGNPGEAPDWRRPSKYCLERGPDLELLPRAADDLVRELGRRCMAAQVGGAGAVGHSLEAGLPNRPRRLLALRDVGEHGGTGQDH